MVSGIFDLRRSPFGQTIEVRCPLSKHTFMKGMAQGTLAFADSSLDLILAHTAKDDFFTLVGQFGLRHVAEVFFLLDRRKATFYLRQPIPIA